MHTIEPFYNWRHLYVSEEDKHSPFFGRKYKSQFSNAVYNYFIHPYWDEFGSKTLYCKILYAGYAEHFAIIELIGEWNDAIENDIMTLKHELAETLMQQGIIYFIFIGENVLNFHYDGKDYYEEWYSEIADEEGWIVMLNLSLPAQQEFKKYKLQYFVELMEIENWRVFKPYHLFQKINDIIAKRLQ